jgi:hypothetical protein
LAAALTAIAGFTAHSANAETHQSVDVSLSGRAVTNPYLDSASGSWSGVGTISIDPRISINNELSTLVLTGDFRLSQHTRRYGTDESLAIGAAAQSRLSERTVISGGLNLTSSRSGALDVLQIAPTPLPDQPQTVSPDVILPDISAVGQRSRVNRYFGHVGVTHILSPTSNIGVNLSGGYTETSRRGGQNYAQANLAVDLEHTLSPRTSLLGTLNIGGSDYSGTAFRDAVFVTPLVGVKSSLSEDTKLTVQAGATLTRFKGGGDHADFAANVSLCHEWLHSSLCGAASRSAAPTAYDGVSTYTSAGLTYSLQSGSADHFSLGAHYGQTKGLLNSASALSRSTRLLGISGEYSHEFGTRTFAFVRPSVTRYISSTSSGSSTRTSFQIEIGIRQRFGDLS